MKVYDFTVPELDYIRKYCNFTPDERPFFECRVRNIPFEQCAEFIQCAVKPPALAVGSAKCEYALKRRRPQAVCQAPP